MNERIKESEKIVVIVLSLLLVILIAICIILFVVNDREAPVITIDEEYLQSCDLNDKQAVLGAVSAEDNVSEQVQVIVVDIIEINNGECYKIYFMAKDEAGNSSVEWTIVEREGTLEEDNNYIESDSETEVNNEIVESEQVSVSGQVTTEVPDETEVYSPYSPVIKLIENHTQIKVGESFRYLNYVESITDNLDEESYLYRRIIVDGNYDTSVAGEYEIRFYVTDSHGNKSNVEEFQLSVIN